ncbi:transcription termination factor MTERF6, chloroplastic/mitochondrial [Cryptomeria japonica]|uniref:transcription termination factor MTERF6, chloroplastic/mitochondrial n=1 Tax=Cryptomeria japonica TaxID=3369 RepID=UPI0027DAA457|nr:transcription termination factor MTERF6, chloroplastic/mitochondrial [Cryptomeria japonica]
MRGQSQLLRNKSDHTAREAIHFLIDSGFTENQLKSTILKNPPILTLTVDRQLKPKMEFLKIFGWAPQDVPSVIARNPRLLSMSLENSLASRIPHLRSLFGSKDHLCKALKIAPQLLLSDFKKQVIPKGE